MRFIYFDEIRVEDVDCSLLMLADKYNVQALVKECIEILWTKMNVENVMEIAYTAYLINNEKLLELASKFVICSSEWKEVKSSAFWQELEEVNPTEASKIEDLLLKYAKKERRPFDLDHQINLESSKEAVAEYIRGTRKIVLDFFLQFVICGAK